jgi:hypothetical protein
MGQASYRRKGLFSSLSPSMLGKLFGFIRSFAGAAGDGLGLAQEEVGVAVNLLSPPNFAYFN